jgi:hypothetical protein
VDVPKTDEQKMKRAEANRERKKRKKDQAGGGKAAPGADGEVKPEDAAEVSAAVADALVEKMEVDAEGTVDA